MDTRQLFDKFFDVGKWAGHDHYKCKKCAFDTLNKEKAISHVTKHLFNKIPDTKVPENLNDTLASEPPTAEEAEEKIKTKKSK